MIAQTTKQITLSIPRSLKMVGMVSGTLGALGIVLSAIAYAPDHPGFLPTTTYLSDMGATPVWPQIYFNAGMLLSSPLRYVFLGLLVLRLSQLGAGNGFSWAALIVGAFSTAGTVIMSAVPYSADATVHEMGIPIYFLGVVILQTLVGLRERKLPSVPRSLPVLCFLVVAVYLTFFALIMLYQSGTVSRTTPILWEWLCAISLLVWVFAHSLLLGGDRRPEIRGPTLIPRPGDAPGGAVAGLSWLAYDVAPAPVSGKAAGLGAGKHPPGSVWLAGLPADPAEETPGD